MAPTATPATSVTCSSSPVVIPTLPERWGKWGVVDNHVDHPLPGGATLALNFAVPDLQPHYKALQQSRAVVEEAQRVRTALPYGLKLSFLKIRARIGPAGEDSVIIARRGAWFAEHRGVEPHLGDVAAAALRGHEFPVRRDLEPGIGVDLVVGVRGRREDKRQ